MKIWKTIYKKLGLEKNAIISSVDMTVIMYLSNYYNQISGLRKLEKSDVLKIIDWALSHDGISIKEEKLREVRKEFE